MTIHRTIAFTSVLTVALLLGGASAYAQSVPVVPPGQGSVACTNLANNLSRGSSDTYTNGEVSTLQIFLYAKGYFSVSPVGQFGPLTLASVQRFQAANGLPAYGYVGPMTRALITGMTCSKPAPTLQSMIPASGAVGTVVTLSGSGFTDDNTVLLDSGALQRIPSTNNGTRITFTVPQAMGPYCKPGFACTMMARLVTPGTYAVSVMTDTGTSNSMTFTVTDATVGNGTLSITGIDAPPSLALGQNGTWTVHAETSSTSGQLHYSVDWGDSAVAASQTMQAPTASNSQSSASFTHAYQTSGTRTATFTVTDDAGHSQAVTSTIQVTPLY